MDQQKVNKAVEMADGALKKMMKENGYEICEGSGAGQHYAQAVGALAAGILASDNT